MLGDVSVVLCWLSVLVILWKLIFRWLGIIVSVVVVLLFLNV